jgi:hypothetical protein
VTLTLITDTWVAIISCLLIYISHPNTKFGVKRPKQTQVIERKLNFYISISDLYIDLRHLGSNPKLPFDISYPYTKFSVNRSKQTQVIERKLNLYFSNSDLDLDHRYLCSNPKLPLDISYPYTKISFNRPNKRKLLSGN